MYTFIKHLPSSAQYLYSVNDIDGSVSKLYRSKSKRRLYLVNGKFIISYSPKDLQTLSDKIVSAYDEIREKPNKVK